MIHITRHSVISTIFLCVTFICAMHSGDVSAQIKEPDPNQSIEDAFNFIVGVGAFNALRYLVVGLFASLILVFSAWATFGLFEAHFVEKQISFKSAFLLFVRLLAMLTISITLISL